MQEMRRGTVSVLSLVLLVLIIPTILKITTANVSRLEKIKQKVAGLNKELDSVDSKLKELEKKGYKEMYKKIYENKYYRCSYCIEKWSMADKINYLGFAFGLALLGAILMLLTKNVVGLVIYLILVSYGMNTLIDKPPQLRSITPKMLSMAMKYRHYLGKRQHILGEINRANIEYIQKAEKELCRIEEFGQFITREKQENQTIVFCEGGKIAYALEEPTIANMDEIMKTRGYAVMHYGG